MLLGGLAAALIREERIRTTEAKAKRLVPVADRLITLGKNGSVHARRQALRLITDRDIVHKLFDEIAPRFTERNGGYTRILKLGPRKGDAAPMAIVELVEGEKAPKSQDSAEQPKRGLLRRRKGKATAADADQLLEAETELPEDLSAEPAEADEPAAQADASDAMTEDPVDDAPAEPAQPDQEAGETQPETDKPEGPETSER